MQKANLRPKTVAFEIGGGLASAATIDMHAVDITPESEAAGRACTAAPSCKRRLDRRGFSRSYEPHGRVQDHPRPRLALSAPVADVVAGLLGEDIDVFQSQFIFKNPRAWGQPWHQDGYYFPYDLQPQVGVWLAISAATLENGCLAVLPGSHKKAIQQHDPDSREGVNQGYLEVRGLEEDRAVPVLMEPGDVLIFHSYLLHRSFDNKAGSRRSAMVYHYGRPGSQPLRPLHPAQEAILRWTPVRRREAVPA